MKKLFFKEINSEFNPEKDIIVEPYCLKSEEDELLDHIELKYYPYDKAEKEIICKQLSKYTKNLIEKIRVKLNHEYQLNFSSEFYKINLYTHVFGLVTLLYDKQERLKKLIKDFSDKNMIVPIHANPINWIFHDNQDWLNKAQRNPSFHYYLYSRILIDNLPSRWEIIDEPIDTSKIFESPRVKKQKFFTKLFNWFFPTYDLSFIMPEFDNLLIASLFSLKRTKSKNKTKYKLYEEVDVDWIFNFEQVLEECLSSTFNKLITDLKTKKLYNKKNRFFIGSSCLSFRDNWQLRAACVKENGGLIIGWQHGGYSYGFFNTLGRVYENEFSSYKFISWGFNKQNKKNEIFLPLPQPIFSQKSHKHQQKNNQIILLGTLMYKCFDEFDSSPNLTDWIEYRQMKKVFIQRIIEDTEEDLIYRNYPNEKIGLSDSNYLKKAIPNLTFDHSSREKLHENILQCKLLILDHPGTTLSFALSANVPTICFWNKEHYNFCPEAEAYFQILEEVGILFRHGDIISDVTLKIKTISNDMQTWWSGTEIQNAREKWCDKYARTSNNWRKEWIRAIINL